MFVLEGSKLLAAAIDSGAEVESLYLAAGARAKQEIMALAGLAEGRGARVFELAPGVMEKVASTVAPQPVIGVVRMPLLDLSCLSRAAFVVACVDVRDPGNLGAVVRVADAAGADGVVCCEGSADPFNPKTVRAAAGSILHLPVVVAGDPRETLRTFGKGGFRRVATRARGGTHYTEATLTGPLALLLGNEAHGLPPVLDEEIDEVVTIPMAGRAESLNVATAASVLCFEVLRRREESRRASTLSGMDLSQAERAR